MAIPPAFHARKYRHPIMGVAQQERLPFRRRRKLRNRNTSKFKDTILMGRMYARNRYIYLHQQGSEYVLLTDTPYSNDRQTTEGGH